MTTGTSTDPTTITAHIWPNIIGGQEVPGAGEETLRDSPAHDVRVASYHSATEADVDAAVTAAARAFEAGDWARTSGAERAALLRRVAARIEAERDELALIETLESGKPIAQAKDEVSSAAGIWYYAASLAQHAYGDAHNGLGSNYLAVTVKEPIGVVGVITPWNFPLLIVSQKLPFALAVGCTAVVKPSDLTPGTTTRLVQILHDEGAPHGVVNLVHADIAEEFTERVVQRARDVAVGDPLDQSTKVGALISEKHLGVVSGYVDLGQQEGASVALGGSQLDSDRGRYYSPTVLAAVPKTARVAREEIFGPVLSVVSFADLAEAVEITNATGYGLSAGVWSRDIDTALGYAAATNAGTVWVNCYMDGFPEISFGGYGASGIGRELGRTAIDEYIEHKSTIIRTGAQAPSWVGGVGEK